MIQLGKRKGFTLIELLVSVSIFSGVVILALGAFAHSADSSIKSTAVRERTEAARTIVDRIGADIQYIYVGDSNDDGVFMAENRECGRDGPNPPDALGFHYGDKCLAMLLQYPGMTKNELVLRVYKDFVGTAGPSIGLVEYPECSIADRVLTCDGTGRQPSNLISDKFVVVNSSFFSGITPITAKADKTTPILRVEVTVKPVNSGTCPNPGERPNPCYTIKTSFVPGV